MEVLSPERELKRMWKQPDPMDAPELATDLPSGVGLNDLKSYLDLVVDRPGTTSSKKALGMIRRALAYAVGPVSVGPDEFERMEPDRDDLLDQLVARVSHAVRGYGGDGRGTSRPVNSFARNNAEREPAPIRYLHGSVLGDGTAPEADDVRGRVTLTHLTVPRPWIARMTKKRGRGKTRSHRPYWAAIHLYAYIVEHYRGYDRFRGPLLHLHSKSVKDFLGLTDDEYAEAVRYLQDEGYITRIVLRGWCPWDPRAKGVYVYVVPRIAKLRGATRTRLKES